MNFTEISVKLTEILFSHYFNSLTQQLNLLKKEPACLLLRFHSRLKNSPLSKNTKIQERSNLLDIQVL